ncbi:MAG: nitrilase family protein [Deltaproteobacteria bacterium]|jgi:predicted amidohydrolase|nr:nitrilase family protein [Deltaproteobacteria bacterium]
MNETKATSPFPSYKVAAVQTNPVFGEKTLNLCASLQRVEEAAAQGAALIVLPELCNTGYAFSSREEAFALAESVPGGEAVRAWAEAARRLGVHIAAGIAEREGADLYNSAVLIGPEGYIGTFRKLHLWDEEKLYFEAGNLGMPVFHTPIGRIGLLICFDVWFPELYRLAAMRGADIICACANWLPMKSQPENFLTMGNILAMGNAHCNGLNIICSARCGVERGISFVGNSIIVGHRGWPLAGPASIDREEIIYAPINLRGTRLSRQWSPLNNILLDRRADVYGLTPGAAENPDGRLPAHRRAKETEGDSGCKSMD